jgi:hypothetical protein
MHDQSTSPKTPRPGHDLAQFSARHFGPGEGQATLANNAHNCGER